MPSFDRLRLLLITILGALLVSASPSPAQTAPPKSDKPSRMDRFLGIKKDQSGGWLFAGFENDGKDGIHLAISKDGYHWRAVNFDRPIIQPAQKGEVMRDPFIQRDPDGSFRMVWTWSLRTPAVLGYSTSNDLVHWTDERTLPVTAAIPTAMNAWAPAMYYEPEKKDWLIFWSSTVPPAGSTGTPPLDHRIYATHTQDFMHFTPAAIFFDPGYNVIDATELAANGQHYLLFKDERTDPLEKHVRIAKGDSMEGPWHDISTPFTERWSEGPAAIPVPNGYLVYYDHYLDPQHYAAAFSPDLVHWSDFTSSISFPSGMRHGSFLHLTTSEYDLLLEYHGPFGDSGVTK